MDVIEQRIATLEDEVKRLRGKLRKLDTDEQLNLSSPLIARTLDGNEIPILRGYTGYQYEPNTYNTITLYGAPYVYMDTDGTYLLIGATATAGFTFPPNAYIKPRTVGSYGTVEIGAYDNGAGGDFTLFSAYSIDVRKNLGLGTSADDTSLGGTPVDGWIFYRTDTDRLRLRANGAWIDIATTDDIVSGAMKVINGGYYLIPAGPGLGTTVTSSASADTYGSWTEMRSASGNALYIVGAIVRTNSNADYTQLDIGTGSAGAETSVSETKLMTPSGASVAETVYFTYPIAVAANTRIACRTADEDASARASDVTLIVVDQADVASL